MTARLSQEVDIRKSNCYFRQIRLTNQRP